MLSALLYIRKEGPNEASMLCEKIKLIIVGEDQQPRVKQIFKIKGPLHL